MKDEICNHFNLPREKVDIIPNAIDASKYDIPVDRGAVRQRYGVGWGEKLILCVGRLVPQKGVEYFIRQSRYIAKKYPEAKFIIVGEGWSRDLLEEEARASRLRKQNYFYRFCFRQTSN